jgi:hypothetical protein
VQLLEIDFAADTVEDLVGIADRLQIFGLELFALVLGLVIFLEKFLLAVEEELRKGVELQWQDC